MRPALQPYAAQEREAALAQAKVEAAEAAREAAEVAAREREALEEVPPLISPVSRLYLPCFRVEMRQERALRVT